MTYGARGLALLACALAGACGGESSDGSSNTVDTGLPPDTPVAQLTPMEQQQVCTASQMAFTAFTNRVYSLPRMCTLYGLGAATQAGSSNFVDLCSAVRDSCIEQPPAQIAELQMMVTSMEALTCEPSTAASSCTVTVAQYEQCLGAMMTEMERRLAPLSTCNTNATAAQAAIDQVDMTDGDQLLAMLPACDPVEACDTTPTMMTVPAMGMVAAVSHLP